MPGQPQGSLRFVILLSVLSMLYACAKTEREELVYQLIQRAVERAEAQDMGGLLDLTREGFTVDPGHHPGAEVRRMLFVAFKRLGRFRIHYPMPVVKLSEDEETATVKMNFLVASKDRVFPELELLVQDPDAWMQAVDKHADLYTLSLELVFDSGDWLVKRARITSYTSPHGRL